MPLAFFFKGLAVGFVIAVPVGPVGVLCLRRTIFEGRLFGLLSGLGAASADAILGIIAGSGLTVVSDWLLDYQNWLRSAGGLFLLYLGLAALRKPAPHLERPASSAENLFGAYVSTLALALINPLTIIVVLGAFAALGFTGSRATLLGGSLLVAGVLLGSLVWGLGISLGVGSFRHAIGTAQLRWLNRISGAILVISGAALIASVLYDRFA